MKELNRGFTLIEIIVSVTIFSIIMISMITIFILSSDLSGKVEINRNMQSNIKNIVETIAEDIRKNKITWVSSSLVDTCDNIIWATDKYKKWTKLCTWLNSYFLAKKTAGVYIRVSDPLNECVSIKNNCVIVKNDWTDIYPLNNNLVSINKLEFYYSKNYIPKVTINMEIRPSAWKWVKSNLIKNNIISFQTTLSERLIETK